LAQCLSLSKLKVSFAVPSFVQNFTQIHCSKNEIKKKNFHCILSSNEITAFTQKQTVVGMKTKQQ
jgi:hypothetical protein